MYMHSTPRHRPHSVPLGHWDPLRCLVPSNRVACGLVETNPLPRPGFILLVPDPEESRLPLLRVIVHDVGGVERRLDLDALADLVLALGPDMLDAHVDSPAKDLVPLP